MCDYKCTHNTRIIDNSRAHCMPARSTILQVMIAAAVVRVQRLVHLRSSEPSTHTIPAIIANQLQFICNASSLAEPHSNNPSLSMREKKGQLPNGHQTQQILLAEHASHCVVASSPLPTNGARVRVCAIDQHVVPFPFGCVPARR